MKTQFSKAVLAQDDVVCLPGFLHQSRLNKLPQANYTVSSQASKLQNVFCAFSTRSAIWALDFLKIWRPSASSQGTKHCKVKVFLQARAEYRSHIAQNWYCYSPCPVIDEATGRKLADRLFSSLYHPSVSWLPHGWRWGIPLLSYISPSYPPTPLSRQNTAWTARWTSPLSAMLSSCVCFPRCLFSCWQFLCQGLQ